MTDQVTGASAARNILLFGSLALSFDQSSFEQLRKTVVETESNSWLYDAVKTLPQACETALSALADSGVLHQPTARLALKQLVDLEEAFMTGRPLDTAFPLPNAVLIPLVVLAQLAQYDEFRRQQESGHGHGRETLGLCTGLLAAAAVSGAHNEDELKRYGAAAVRLGMLAGLVVDGQDVVSGVGRSRSLSAAWSSAEGRGEMERIVKENGKAYVSVYYDVNRATITCGADDISDLTRRLHAAGISASEIGLYGRFHSSANLAIVDELIAFCNAHNAFRLPHATSLATPTRSNDASAALLKDGPLHAHALRSILVEPPSWFDAFGAAIQDNGEDGAAVEVLSFGLERSVPPSLALRGPPNVRVVHLSDQTTKVKADRRSERTWMDSDIAVVGMSCKVPGANSLEEFWDMLVAGRSQHREIDPARFSFEDTPFRTSTDANMNRKWFANLIEGHDQFDHRFFKKSARESASMDPQQRQLLQVAYQAVEQSGYFQQHFEGPKRIGCFVGVCLGDYDNNVASHAANAFTATGNLQGFISGKVSHFFGWTGPALTINTACSSSLVAVHQACQSILSGECDGALAGGSHVMTSAEWFQNLAAGSFLSPTGQCKPFDMKADGYCRGEGVGAVFLKKMSKAVADGDPILGVIAASAVQQNQNCTPIFVPNVPSLGDLFTNVMAKAKVKPSQISVVEAHGTGTAVGDPAEYDSIRKALGGEVNRGSGKQLMVSSVKGLVGHMECTSGVISLIKVLLMMDKGVLPPQASFETVNPAIKASPADRMFIPTRPQPWDADLRAALINNYGASGSNASAVVLQAPDLKRTEKLQMPAGAKYPFWISGFDNKALARNVKALRNYLARSAGNIFLAGLSYNLAYQTNRTLDSALIFTARSLGELDENLAAFDSHKNASSATGSASATAAPTVILCFGGQVSSYIGLDPQVYHSVAILRKHLDRVDAVIQSLACPSIFPAIFQRTPVADTVHLQTMLFAMQYACAQSWIDSGIRPASLVGHSFGELTALCIAGILSLEDTVKMIARRAALVRDAWGPDKGAMMAVEADLGDVKSVLADVNVGHADQPATIACFNGPRSFTLAGPTSAIDHVAARFEDLSAKNKTVKSKRLKVTNAFHSVLVDAIYDDLLRTAEGLTFRKPAIPLELATEEGSREPEFTTRFVADHMRKPVYFHHAVERLARRYSSGPCIFLEAGTNSTITSMAARALAHVNGTHTFHGVNMANCDDGWNKLTDVTMSLWRAGLRTQHWAHHGLQRRHQLGLKPLLLPPYQFDPDARHWMELKAPPKVVPRPVGDETESSASVAEKQPEGPLTFCGFQDGDAQNQALFRVNTATDKYKHLLSGHVTMETAPILSATLQISFVMDAICSIHPEYRTIHRQPQIQDVQYKSPVCANSARTTWIEVTIESRDGGHGEWNFEVFSTAYQDQKQSTTKRMVHTIGKIQFRNLDDSDLKRQLARYERLFGHGRASELLQGSVEIDEVLGNRTIYRLFSEIVDYGDEFRGLQKMIVRGNETAGHVLRLNQDPELWFDPHLADTFCQLGGLWINCVVDRGQSHVYLANGIDQWIRLHAPDKRPEKFDVFAVHHRPSEQLSLTDVFVFDAEAGVLVEVILGIAYVKIPKISMEKLLTSLTEPSWINKKSASRGEDVATAAAASPPVPAPPVLDSISRSTQPPSAIASTGRPQASVKKAKTQKTADQGLQGLTSKVKAIIADLSGLEVHEIKDDSELADLGIDSLAGMEMVHEIESTLKVKLPEAAILVVTDMPGLIKCVAEAVGITAEESSGDSDSDTSSILSSADSTTAITNTSLSTPSSESDKEDHPGHEADLKPDAGELRLPFSTVMEAFNETKRLTDGRVAEMGQTSYVSQSLPLQNELTVALTIEAFESLGAGFRNAAPGEQLTRIPHGKEHNRFVTYLYEMLEAETQIIKLDSGVITRTAVPLPQRRSRDIYDELNRDHPDQHSANELTYYAGENLARVLSGETDGVKLIFGSTQGRNLVSHWYAEWPLNRVLIAQMEDFFSRLSGKLPHGISRRNPLRILEMGAGTGGTTKRIVPLLARLQVPVEYTFTDLAPSFVSAARKTWGKQYPWMKFRAHDIEKAPEKDLEGTQHFVIASNAIHATKSIAVSTANVRKVLRDDGFLVMMEMTRTPYWVDLIFGLFEGWWLFEDGRRHALTHESRWEKDLRGVGFGCVDWTDGERPESAIQRIIVAAASGNGSENSRCEHERLPVPTSHHDGCLSKPDASPDCAAREELVAKYVRDLTQGFDEGLSDLTQVTSHPRPDGDGMKCVLITGGTGGLGTHLVAEAALRSDVGKVICLNRLSKQQNPRDRQLQALQKKGIVSLPAEALAKIHVYETDLTQPVNLGLPEAEYRALLHVPGVTHIVHNAWLMHSKWPVKRFEPQLRIMRNLLGFARDLAISNQNNNRTTSTNTSPGRVTFQFISSIATVGHHPLWTGRPVVPEERLPVESVLPTGYGEAKYICERMMDATVHKFPGVFRGTVVRLGQIAGNSNSNSNSSATGSWRHYWNPMEHVPFLLKSSQTLGALPDLPGTLGWTPCDLMARGLLEIALRSDDQGDEMYPVYHIENPIRQSWRDMLSVLADEMGISSSINDNGIIPFDEWVRRVREWPRKEDNGPQGKNPGYMLVDFLDSNFVRMSCGGLLMATARSREHSPTMAGLGPVSEELARGFVRGWREMGFLA